MRVLVFGGSGFVGRAVVAEYQRAGAEVSVVSAPRLQLAGRDTRAALRATSLMDLQELNQQIPRQVDIVVNAAGMATPSASSTDTLYGANALLPAVLYRSAVKAGVGRFIHISSAAVLGREHLQDTWDINSDTPYGNSKALGERVLRASYSAETELIIHRPTSVHGRGRSVTKQLQRVALSPLSTYAGPRERDTPQVLVQNVAAATVFLGTHPCSPSKPAIQPSEGLTTRSVLQVLGLGRTPRRVPAHFARALISLSTRVPHPSVSAQARRLEMLWFGQEQEPGWFEQEGFTPPYGRDAWERLSKEII